MTPEERQARHDVRKEARRQTKEAARIEAEKNQKPVKTLTITIEWKKSRTWGSNPHAEAAVEFHDGTFTRKAGYTASGCGYDKESTVVAQVFNDFLLYKLWAKTPEQLKRNDYNWRRDGGAPYGISSGTADDKAEYRYYSGGIGMSCYPVISEYIGGKLESIASGNTFDVWRYTDGKEVKPNALTETEKSGEQIITRCIEKIDKVMGGESL